MTPLTICESIYKTTIVLKCSYTLASKLMDQLKVFVGMAIFLSQMVTSPCITSVSNSAPIAARCKPRREMDPLAIYPHSAGEAHGGHEGSSDRTCYLAYIIHPTLSPHVCMPWTYNASTAMYFYGKHIIIFTEV